MTSSREIDARIDGYRAGKSQPRSNISIRCSIPATPSLLSSPRGNEAIWKGDELVGRATSGAYGWRLKKSLALAMVRPEHGDEGAELEIQILGERYKATVVPESPYDPENARLRA